MPKVLMTRSDIPEIAKTKLQEKFDLDIYDEKKPIPRAELLKRIVGKDAIFCMVTDKIDREFLDAAGPSLKVVSTMSVGYDHIDMNEVKKRKIMVGFTPDVLTDATAELTVALLLATTRRLFEARAELDNGGWLKCSWSPLFMLGAGVAGSTVGIFGLGRIGMGVLKRLAGFSVSKFLYTSNQPKTLEYGLPSAECVPFDQLVAESDFVICTAALNDSTKHKFNREVFSAMKKTAVFINTSRGGLVDQEDLVWALQTGEIRAAGLDVMTPEPLPAGNVLCQLKNCTLLPHIGSAEETTRQGMATLAADNIIGGLSGNEMPRRLC